MSNLRRKVKQGEISFDADACTLLVNYELQEVDVDDNGRVVEVVRSKEKQHVESIPRATLLAPETNLATYAERIVEGCKYVHNSRSEEVEQILIKMKKSILAKSKSTTSVAEEKKSMDRDFSRSQLQVAADDKYAAYEPEDNLPPASLDDLDDYLELLYEGTGKSEQEKEAGLKAQIYGTSMILKLCREIMNLELLIQNPTVMGALTRVLQEDFKKSSELTLNILKIFLSFSNFIEMHTLMANYRIGLLTMKAIEYEVKRAELRDTEKVEKDAEYEADLAMLKSEHAGSEDLKSQIDKLRRQRDKDTSKRAKQVRSQNKIFFVGFYILLNLAEDVSVERKMVKKGLITSLDAVLSRSSVDLVSLCLSFLKKLCIFEENKDLLRDMNIVSKLSKFINCAQQQIVIDTLKVLFNLSFDAAVREQIVQLGLLPKLVQLLKQPPLRARTLKLLYHLSVDDRCKSMFSYTEGVSLVMGMVVNFPGEQLPKELAGLAVNLSHNSKNCELIIANKGLNLLVDRLTSASSVATVDVLLLKIIRNISNWTFYMQQEQENPDLAYKYRGLWSPHIKSFLEMVMTSDSHELLIELLAVLANLTRLDIPANLSWPKIFKEQNLLHLLSKLLVPGMCQNDLLLQVVLVISSAAVEPQVCELLATTNIIGLLYQMWQERCEGEPELTLQLIVCFHRFFLCEASREEAMYGTRIVADIMECLSHKNAAVRRAADSILEFVLEQDRKDDGELGKLGDQIKKKRFESYNSSWLQELANLESESMGYDQNVYARGGALRFSHSDDLDVDPSLNWRSQMGGYGEVMRLDDDENDESGSYNGRWDHESEMSSKYRADRDDFHHGRNYKVND